MLYMFGASTPFIGLVFIGKHILFCGLTQGKPPISYNFRLFSKLKTRTEVTVERSNTIALDFGRELFGAFGALVFAGVVAISCFGATNGISCSVAHREYALTRSSKRFDVYYCSLDLFCRT
jgi:hypothetical protein